MRFLIWGVSARIVYGLRNIYLKSTILTFVYVLSFISFLTLPLAPAK